MSAQITQLTCQLACRVLSRVYKVDSNGAHLDAELSTIIPVLEDTSSTPTLIYDDCMPILEDSTVTTLQSSFYEEPSFSVTKLKGEAARARLCLRLSKCHIVGNHMSLIIVFCFMCYFCVSSNMKKSH